MSKVLKKFLNEYKDSFEEFFDKKVILNLQNRKDYKEITDEIKKIYEKYPKLEGFIKDEVPATFNKEETEAFRELYNSYDSLKNIEILEAFKFGCN